MSVHPHVAPYARIKRELLSRIESGEWPVARRVPSENQLAADFGVSRMTARRALSELTQEGWLVRSQGVGSFVADRKPALPMLEVRNIAEEIAQRGHAYAGRVVKLEAIEAGEVVAVNLGVMTGERVFHSVIVHHDDGVPVQVEDRYTNPALAPGYLEQDFTRATPSAYLSRVAPMDEVEHMVEAVLPTPQAARWLRIDAAEPCLQITRRTWSAGQVASYARLLHPGRRYRMGGHAFVPRAQRQSRRRG